MSTETTPLQAALILSETCQYHEAHKRARNDAETVLAIEGALNPIYFSGTTQGMAGEILAAEVRRTTRELRETAAREKYLRDALTELIDARGGGGTRINQAWTTARRALRASGQGILRFIEPIK